MSVSGAVGGEAVGVSQGVWAKRANNGDEAGQRCERG